MNQDTSSAFKVVLVFNLQPGMADEELRRSTEPESFPNRLASQPGFVSMELVRVSDERTLSLQTWRSPQDWWAALETVKGMPSARDGRPPILVSREFYAGPVVVRLP